MNALVNLGLLHTHMSRFAEAERAFREAKDVGAVVGDLSRLIRIELHLARLRIKQGERDAARALCDRAREMALQTGDTFADGDAEQVAGIIARLDGDVAKAEQHFLRAEQIGIERKDLILQGETAKELAELYRWNGRNKDTLQRLNQAHRLFLQLRARRELADVDRRTASLEADFLDVVRKWGESIEEKDVYTQGHCVRVADLSCALWARVSAGDDTSLFWFRIGALLHDVGKLMIPAEVLNKPGKLSDEEWALIQRHPTAGVELLADIDFPWDVRPIVESHHERWDGKGYPHKLAGEEIPLTARVLCIADVYDALTSKRSYKQAFTHDEAMEIMRGDVGRQFDPTLFAAFEEIVRRGTWRNTPAGGSLAIAS
jgi:putative nucleotidyltransferase with HDIG domain